VTGTLMNLLTDKRFNHQAEVVGGVREAECASLLQTFFRKIRENRRKKKKMAGN
jgi:tRNA(adenine34) deaminase